MEIKVYFFLAQLLGLPLTLSNFSNYTYLSAASKASLTVHCFLQLY